MKDDIYREFENWILVAVLYKEIKVLFDQDYIAIASISTAFP
jgi:hypothetical protein